MEVDTSHQASLQVPVDDDLINYESDAAGNVEEHTTEYDANPGIDTLLDNVAADKEFSAAHVENVSHDDDAPVAHGAEDTSEPAASGVATEGEAVEAVPHTDDIDFNAGVDASNPAETEPTVGDEIDYSIDDLNDQTEIVENNDGANDAEASAAPELHLAQAGEIEEAENHEISWEQDEDAETADIGTAGKESEGEAAEVEQHEMFSDQPQAEEEEEEETAGEMAPDAEADTAAEINETEEGKNESHGEVGVGNEDDEPTQTGAEDSADSHFPSITVQYQGDEFPFFSYSSDGFFSDESILNECMQSLLRSFRSQLAGDIAAEDELVFQIDELGLEFSEVSIYNHALEHTANSHDQSNTSNLTMHQVLEIFELLVKNDDPDGARTLYTYLFVRPNTARRYEFLVESATSGRGLDEVNYLFPQQVSHKNSVVEHDESLMIGSMPLFHEGSPEDVGQADMEYDEGDLQQNIEYVDDDDEEQYGVSAEFDEAIENAGDTQMNEEHDHGQETSATSTLQGDGETAEPSVDADTETAVDNDAEDHLYMADTADFAEIDWRDEDDAADDSLGDAALAAAKRPRDNDELELEDEKGVKRRRP
ncbi:hypothetical protein K4F52_003079 [Lecanicillium sp. MT-2017a]|nr:hypothetical protein K4F52_003079 [Lecanicillium sp. MT-2017a]